MTIKDVLKNKIGEINPFAIHRRKKMKESLKKESITFLTPNCIGGILFHDLGLKFMSPTVNLMMSQTDFLKFVKNLDAYLNGKFTYFKHQEYECPCAYLVAEGLPRITVHFTHYKTREEAENKWNSRKLRIDKNNIFIFIEERDGITAEELRSLSSLKVRGIVAFTYNEYPDIPYAVYLEEYHKEGEVGNILKRNYFDDSREYEKYFDFVKWFNEADGGNYCVSPFVR